MCPFSSLFLNWFLLLTTRNPNPQSLVSFPPDLVDLKKCTAWELQVKFFGGKTQETAPQIEKLPQGGRGESSVYMWFLVSGKYCNQEYIFFQKASTSLVKPLLVVRNSGTMEKFSALLDARRYKDWAHKTSSWEHLTIWRPVLPIVPEHRALIPALHPELFQGCCRSAACDLIHMEVDDKLPRHVPICSWQPVYWALEEISPPPSDSHREPSTRLLSQISATE